MEQISRRRITVGAAWTVPVVSAASVLPAFAASGLPDPCTSCGTLYMRAGNPSTAGFNAQGGPVWARFQLYWNVPTGCRLPATTWVVQAYEWMGDARTGANGTTVPLELCCLSAAPGDVPLTSTVISSRTDDALSGTTSLPVGGTDQGLHSRAWRLSHPGGVVAPEPGIESSGAGFGLNFSIQQPSPSTWNSGDYALWRYRISLESVTMPDGTRCTPDSFDNADGGTTYANGNGISPGLNGTTTPARVGSLDVRQAPADGAWTNWDAGNAAWFPAQGGGSRPIKHRPFGYQLPNGVGGAW